MNKRVVNWDIVGECGGSEKGIVKGNKEEWGC